MLSFVRQVSLQKATSTALRVTAQKFRSSSSNAKPPSSDEDKKLAKAAKNVASLLKGNKSKIESELIEKLRGLSTASESAKSAENVLQGLTAANDRPELSTRNAFKQEGARRHRYRIERHPTGTDNVDPSAKQPRMFIQPKHIDPTAQRLFEGPSLDVFTRHVEKQVTGSDSDRKFDRQMMLSSQLPTNSFEEHIMLTQQGKMWHYPIDNEQGMESEAAVPFYEHVFLEELLNDGFPKKGPIRHFMELVCVGLSANPFMTVQQKHEHIAWYREYFKQHESLIKETIADK